MGKINTQIDYLINLSNKESFSRSDLILEISRKDGREVGEARFKAILQKFLKDGRIVRVGRNAYCVAEDGIMVYSYNYSALACDVAELIEEKHPYLDFSMAELIQLNEFVNHQLAHNVVFVSVEDNLGDFVFDTLKEKYPGKVLINPTTEIYHQYWCDDMIVIQKLISEAPMGHKDRWHIRLEKLLVDLMVDSLLKKSVSEAEYATIFEEAFAKYAIEESCLFRYAKRRGAERKILTFIQEQTTVNLRTR